MPIFGRKCQFWAHITLVNFANNIFVPSTIIRSMQDSLRWLFPSLCSSAVRRHISHTVTFRLMRHILVCCHILAKFSHYFTCKQEKLRKLQRKKSRLTKKIHLGHRLDILAKEFLCSFGIVKERVKSWAASLLFLNFGNHRHWHYHRNCLYFTIGIITYVTNINQRHRLHWAAATGRNCWGFCQVGMTR